MVTKFKLIYRKNRIYRIVLCFIFLVCFLGIAVAIKMQEPSLSSQEISKWAYRSQLEQGYILSDIIFNISYVFFGAGCLGFVGILYDDIVFNQEEYRVLLEMGTSKKMLMRIVILRYVPCFFVPFLCGFFLAGMQVLTRYMVLIVILFILLVYWCSKIGKIKVVRDSGITGGKKTQRIATIKKSHIFLRFAYNYKNFGICLSLVIAIFVFIGSFCTGFVYNSVFDKNTFEKNFFINNTSIDVVWKNYDAYLKNIELLKKTYADKYENIYMFLDEEVVINEFMVDAYISDSFERISTPMFVSGRAPFYDNEISIGFTFAKLQGIHIGDIVDVSANNHHYSYLVTGIIQAADMGFDCELTYDGYKKIEPEFTKANSCLCFSDDYGVDEVEQFIKAINKNYKADIQEIDNKLIQSEQLYNSYKETILFITIIIAIIVCLVIILFVRLITKCWIFSMQSQFRIMHIMGINRRNIKIFKNSIIHFYVLLGMMVGLLFALFLDPLYNFVFSKIGLHRVDFKYPVWLMIGIAIIQVILTIIMYNRLRREEY